jgi:exo-beta-1,3-glucanase (GH17 family)
MYQLSNIHAWFANQTVEASAKWTLDFFQESNVGPAGLLSNKPQMFIAETGWPTQSSDAGNARNGASDASEAGLQTFLDTFVCQANTANVGYFFFEVGAESFSSGCLLMIVSVQFFDEQWKDRQFGGVEGWWGLFHAK